MSSPAFSISHDDGRLWVHINGWEYSEPVSGDKVIEMVKNWILSCKMESELKLWICPACTGCSACAVVSEKKPDCCICEMDISEQEKEDRAFYEKQIKVDWTEGNIQWLPVEQLDKMRRRQWHPSVLKFTLSRKQAWECIEDPEVDP